ncbi:hypothetical protein CYMTET_27963, partial [Cymbomonas tetramitiformis]
MPVIGINWPVANKLSLLHILTSYIAISSALNNNWGWADLENPIKSNLLDINYLDDAIWVAGEADTIYVSEDEGATWSRRSSEFGDRYSWNGLSFLNATRGWVVGSYGLVLHTLDGGRSWTQQLSHVEIDPAAPSLNYNAVHHVAGLSWCGAFVVGDAGNIFSTGDGGATWTQQVSKTAEDLMTLFFASTTTGWAAGRNGVLLSTADAGENWVVQEPSGGTWTRFSLFFTTEDRGWAVGEAGGLVWTNSSGAQWNVLPSCTVKDLYGVVVDPQHTNHTT